MELRPVKSLQSRLSALSVRTKGVFIQSVWGLVEALEARDPYTRSHSDNVVRYAVAVGRTLGLCQRELDTLKSAAMIHDIGKIGVPDAILRKPGRLTPDERQVMEEHPLIAVRILDPMRFLDRELPIVRHHHERWDGKGYPDHIAGKRIPLESRILAAADAFDAMTSTRVYQESRGVSQAIAILQECAGTQFDPDVTAAFREWIRQTERRLNRPGALACSDLLEDKQCALAA
jgi:HD-GYP domain-containing protein (c-di-GMP phosphodiesterase class II)